MQQNRARVSYRPPLSSRLLFGQFARITNYFVHVSVQLSAHIFKKHAKIVGTCSGVPWARCIGHRIVFFVETEKNEKRVPINSTTFKKPILSNGSFPIIAWSGGDHGVCVCVPLKPLGSLVANPAFFVFVAIYRRRRTVLRLTPNNGNAAKR